MIKNKIIAFLSTALMFFCIQSNVNAIGLLKSPISIAVQVDYDDVMPTDIVMALNILDTINPTSSESYEFANKLLTAIELPRSMSIKVPKIDMNKVHDTNPLEDWQIVNLRSHGFSDNSIAEDDAGNYYDIERTWNVPSDMIPLIKGFFPELKSVDISNWTYADYFEYSKVADELAKVYAPTAQQAAALEARNITLSDAQMLLKDFYTYDGILEQSDATIKEYIEAYYQFTIDNIKELAELSERKIAMSTTSIDTDGTVVINAPPEDLQGTTYRWVNFEGYQSDWFHQDANSHNSTTRATQKAAALKGFNKLYNKSGTTFTCTNMWGTWSNSQNGAHEGIDYVSGTNPTIYSIATGDVNYYSATSTAGILGIYDGTNTHFYYHMDTIKIRTDPALSGTVTDPSPKISVACGDSVGTQGKKGNATGNHVHFEVGSGKRTSGYSESDNTLSSANPYTAITKFIP